MKLKPKFQSASSFINSHEAAVLLVYCSDFRFRKAFWEFQDKVVGKNKKIDRVIIPGGHLQLFGSKYGYPKGDAAARFWLEFLTAHHHIKNIILIGHGGCAAYASAPALKGKTPEQLRQIQLQDLTKAKRQLAKKLKNITIKLYFAEPVGKNIKFSEVEG